MALCASCFGEVVFCGGGNGSRWRERGVLDADVLIRGTLIG